MKTFKQLVIFFFIISVCTNLFAQEAINSIEDLYYDFLALNGAIEKPTLNYKTLSDLQYDLSELSDENNIWLNNKLSTNYLLVDDKLNLKIYPLRWYSSYNSAAPYGQNDGGLWQGKGFNTNLTTGVRLESYGFECTFKPNISFSQNKEFKFPTPHWVYEKPEYIGKAGIYGNYSLPYIDAPQRFGKKSFFTYDWGDSEVRYSYHNFTIGFGTEYIWLGPAVENPIMHSNNAAGYPKVDFGLRNQNITIKDINLGNIEFRYWLGKLSESNYFDNDKTNNSNLISGLAFTYEFPFLPGLRVSLNRTMLSKWSNINPYTTLSLLIPAMKYKMGYDESDQRASVCAEYFIPQGGIDIYLEWGKNDYNNGLDNIMRYPFHTQAITAGFKKNINYKSHKDLQGQFIFEICCMEGSMDYHFFYDWGDGNNFYTHAIIKQGYVNKGQYLGAGIGSGGNSQYVSYKLYYPKGFTSFFVRRTNPDLNYFYYIAPRNNDSKTPNEDVKTSISALFDFGVSSLYYITNNLSFNLSLIFEDQHNPLNYNFNLSNDTAKHHSDHRYNFVSQLELNYYF